MTRELVRGRDHRDRERHADAACCAGRADGWVIVTEHYSYKRHVMSHPRTIGVALLGLGNVGGGVVKLLEDNAAAIEARLGARHRGPRDRGPRSGQGEPRRRRRSRAADDRRRRGDRARRRRHRVRADRRHHARRSDAVLAAIAARQARRHREQGAARRARRRGVRRGRARGRRRLLRGRGVRRRADHPRAARGARVAIASRRCTASSTARRTTSCRR